jgi:hypothetical protein
MDTETAPSSVTIERTPAGLVITMPVPRSGCAISFLSVWLLGWALGEYTAAVTLIERFGALDPGMAFLLTWLVLWTAGGAAAATALATMLGGCETITLAPDGLRRRIAAFGVGVTRVWDPTRVEDLRVMPAGRGSGAFFGFEYGRRTLRWGSGLSQDDARAIVEAMLEYGSPGR